MSCSASWCSPCNFFFSAKRLVFVSVVLMCCLVVHMVDFPTLVALVLFFLILSDKLGAVGGLIGSDVKSMCCVSDSPAV